MRIIIKLVASLQVDRFDNRVLDYPNNISVHQVISGIGLAENEEIVVLVNGIHANRNARLVDQDTLTLMPFVDGG